MSVMVAWSALFHNDDAYVFDVISSTKRKALSVAVHHVLKRHTSRRDPCGRGPLSWLRPLSKGTAAAVADTAAGGPVSASVAATAPVGEPAPVSMFTSAPAGAPATVCASAHVGALSGMRGCKMIPFGAAIFFGRQRVSFCTLRQRGNSVKSTCKSHC